MHTNSILYKINLLLVNKKHISDLLYSTNQRYKIINNAKLSKNSMNVLESAFGTRYDNDPHNANMYDLANGSKGMDWWNFPWDLSSSQPQYMITYDDMKDILENVLVKMEKNDIDYVRYSKKLSSNVLKLNTTIMNSHGGHLRVVKIIYCVRNFMSVAIKYNLVDDITNLKTAIKHLLSININELYADSNQLNPTYGASSTFKPKNIHDKPENRTRDSGLMELKLML